MKASKRNPIILAALAVLGHCFAARPALADYCYLDVLAGGEICTNENPYTVHVESEIPGICPSWAGNSTLKTQCEDTGIFPGCRAHVEAELEKFLGTACTKTGEKKYYCTPDKLKLEALGKFEKKLSSHTQVSQAGICQSIVLMPKCGNGIIESGEECDGSSFFSNVPDGSTCAMCKVVAPPPGSPLLGLCGNNQLDATEECEDGNTRDNDGCNWNCKWEPKVLENRFSWNSQQVETSAESFCNGALQEEVANPLDNSACYEASQTCAKPLTQWLRERLVAAVMIELDSPMHCNQIKSADGSSFYCKAEAHHNLLTLLKAGTKKYTPGMVQACKHSLPAPVSVQNSSMNLIQETKLQPADNLKMVKKCGVFICQEQGEPEAKDGDTAPGEENFGSDKTQPGAQAEAQVEDAPQSTAALNEMRGSGCSFFAIQSGDSLTTSLLWLLAGALPALRVRRKK